MNITLTFYLIDILGGLSVISCLFWILALITLVILVVVYLSDEFHVDNLQKYLRYIKITLSIFIVELITFLLIPSQKTMYLMASSEIAKEIVANPGVKKISDKILTIVNSELDELTQKEGK